MTQLFGASVRIVCQNTKKNEKRFRRTFIYKQNAVLMQGRRCPCKQSPFKRAATPPFTRTSGHERLITDRKEHLVLTATLGPVKSVDNFIRNADDEVISIGFRDFVVHKKCLALETRRWHGAHRGRFPFLGSKRALVLN